MTYTYYPGCSLESTSKAYDESLRAVCKKLKISLVDLPDWNCCGATMYMSIDESLAFSLSARNLAIAETLGHDIMAPCSSCFTILSKTHRAMRDSPHVREDVNNALKSAGLSYNGTLRIRHPLDVLVHDVGVEMIAMEQRRSLEGIRIANYYGCQIVRPERGFDDRENPTSMDILFEALGAEIVYFPMKVKCCGGMIMTTNQDVGLRLNKEILGCARENEADCIVTTCPLCQINLEGYQNTINRRFGTRFKTPVLFFTQLLGLALGLEQRQLGLQRQLIPIRLPDRALTPV